MKKKILLIQSTQTQGNGTKQYLEDSGYKVIWAGSGLTALMLARNMTIDLILLDVALPDIEGMDLCRRFRQRPDTHAIPIILLIARGYLPEQAVSAATGPDVYLPKPFHETELDEKISALLSPKAAPAQAPHVPAKQSEMQAAAPALITVAQQAPAPEPDPEPEPEPEPEYHEAALPEIARSAQALPDEAPVRTEAFGGMRPPEADDGREQEQPILPLPQTGAVVIDPDTGLFGRPQFEAMLDKEFKKAVRFKQHMSLMLIDLDGRNRGQTADEALVKSIISLVQKTIREVDTPAWWSGESFMVLLPGTGSNDALQAAARTLESVALHPFSWPDATRVTMNVGVAGLPNAAITTQQQLVEQARTAMLRARDLMTPPPFDVRLLRR
jgi:diguanylate cyclase (GGDEF)-like protein